MSTPEKRSLNPEKIHQLWFAIIGALKRPPEDVVVDETSRKLPPAFVPKQSLYLGLLNIDNSGDDKSNNKSITAESFDITVQNAIKEGLLLQSTTAIKANSSDNDKQEDEVPDGAKDGTKNDCDDQDKRTLIGLPLNVVDNQLELNKTLKDSLTHDWYCFECHLAGTGLYECQNCWRVFHFNCCSIANQVSVKIEPEDPSIDFSTTSVHPYKFDSHHFVCPICFLKQKYHSYSIGSRQFSQEEFNKILSYTYTRFKTKSSQISRSLLKLKDSLQSSSLSLTSFLSSTSVNATQVASSNTPSSTNISTSTYANELNTLLALQYLSYCPVDLGDIENKLEKSSYETIGDFLGDCLSFEHMLEVVTISSIEQQSSKRRIRDTLTRMLDACRYDLKEMLGCVDCYRNSNQLSDKFWFCRPCQPPHLLVFAKQLGYPFWPAKVIYPRFAVDVEAFDHFDVRFFGTNHERCQVHKSNIKDINSTMSELRITKILPSLKKALAELGDHRQLLEKPDSDCNNQAVDLNEECNSDSNDNEGSILDDRPNSSLKNSLDLTEDDNTNESAASSNGNSNCGKRKSDNNFSSSKLTRIEEVKREVGDEIVENGTNKLQEQSSDSDNENFVDASESIEDGDNTNNNENDGRITEEDETDIDESVINNGDRNEEVDDEQDSKEKIRDEIRTKLNSSDDTNNGYEVKRRRGRPKKYNRVVVSAKINKTANKVGKKSKSGPLSKERVRRKKIIYSPQSNKYKKSSAAISPIVPVSKLTLSTRGRKSKLFSNLSSLISAETASNNPEPPKRARRIRNFSPKSTYTVPINSTRIKLEKSPVRKINNHERHSKSSTTSKETSTSQAGKRHSQYLSKKLVLERERLARRKLKLKKENASISNLPKHIPPVTATKSSPVFPVLNGNSTFPNRTSFQQPVSSTPVIAQNFVQPSINSGYASNSKMCYPANGFNTTYPPINGYSNCANNSAINSRTLVQNQQVLAGTQLHQQKPYNPPSRFLKPLSNGNDTANDDTTDDDINLSTYNTVDNENSNTSNSNSNLDRFTITSKIYTNNLNHIQQNSAMTNNNVDDEEDEDPYLYDDEQLEEQINDYLAYQEEKALEVQQMQQLQYHPQYYQQADYARFAPNMPPNGLANHYPELIDLRFNHSIQQPKRNASLEPQIPMKMYIDYSNAPIYSPTKKNQRLVNTYLHHVDHNHFPPQRTTDYLAQLMIRKEEFDLNAVELHEPINNNIIKKRGRPPKDLGDDVMERSGKAKSLVEKTYLQESSCNRLCLTKNMKNFKRFRDFVESQNKTDMEKLRSEVESLKKEVQGLTSKKSELETDLKRERDIVRRCDPAMVTQMEEKHKLAISLIKQKQWCINCEAEAAYFCCFNTNYCSPECQHKHWNMGHKNNCTRNRPNHGKNVSLSSSSSFSATAVTTSNHN